MVWCSSVCLSHKSTAAAAFYGLLLWAEVISISNGGRPLGAATAQCLAANVSTAMLSSDIGS